jgi:hypothetical protein
MRNSILPLALGCALTIVAGTATATAETYIVSGIPFADYDPATHTDMNVRFTYVRIADPQNSAAWFTSDKDIDITSIGGIVYGTTRQVESPTVLRAPPAGYRLRTNPNPFLGWTCNTSCNADVPTSIVFEDAVTPLPATLPLFATGLAGLAWLQRRRRGKVGSVFNCPRVEVGHSGCFPEGDAAMSPARPHFKLLVISAT